MSNWKYLVLDTGDVIFPVLFPASITHDEFFKGFENQKKYTAVSAGFVSFLSTTKSLVCYGESVSMQLKSCPEDSVMVNRLLRGS